VVVKTQLTGMPECKFGINDKLLIRESNNGVAADAEKTQQKGI